MTDLNQYQGFFNPGIPEPQTAQTASLSEFRPNPKKGNGVFKAVVRFIPSIEDAMTKSKLMKYTCFLTHPVTQQKKSLDLSYASDDIISRTFFALRQSDNSVLKENADKFKRHQQFASLIQVISCATDPSLENKILVWKFGIKIDEKIDAEMHPQMGQPKNPYDIINGRPFEVVVKQVGDFPNYDGCNFKDYSIEESGLKIQVNGQWVRVTPGVISTPEGQSAVINYIKQNAPDMSRYEYHEWTAEERQFVNECVQIYTNPQASMQAYAASQNPGMAAIGQQGMPQQAAAQPFVSQAIPAFGTPAPAQAAPSVPAFGGGIPTPPPAPQMGVPVSNVNPVDNRGFNPTQLPGDINSLIGGGAPKGSESEGVAAPQLGIGLGDILNNGMM